MEHDAVYQVLDLLRTVFLTGLCGAWLLGRFVDD